MLKIHFAPLQGYTESPYRIAHAKVCGGVDTYYTPFVRLEHGEPRKKDLRDALPENNQGLNVVPQIICNSRNEVETLCGLLVEMGHKQIDVNMGCPFPMQTRAGRGAGLLNNKEKITEVLHTIADIHEKKGTTFSIKMRLGQESAEECMQVAEELNQTPVEYITMHPRLGRDQYKGELDYDKFEAFMEVCKHNLLFNGMLQTADDIEQIEKKYPNVGAVMIGRGLLARPTLTSEYATGTDLSTTQVVEKIMQMHEMIMHHYSDKIEGGEGQLLMKMHTFWEYMEPTIGHKAVKKIIKSGNIRNYMKEVSELSKL